MYNINDIFYDDKEYSQRVKWCNENGYVIKEIDADEEGKRRFQIQETPPLTEEQILNNLRDRREAECFIYINRGILWYNTLTSEQQQELNTWYQAWLNVPQLYENTHPNDINDIIPNRPEWLK